MKILFKIIVIFFLQISIISCSSKNIEPTEIRLVSLQGKYRPVKTRIPDENAKIMQENKIITSKNFPVDPLNLPSLSNDSVNKKNDNLSKNNQVESSDNKTNEQYSNVESKIGSQPAEKNIEYDLDDKFANNSKKSIENSYESADSYPEKNSDEIQLSLQEAPNFISNGDINKISNNPKILTYNNKKTKDKQILTKDYNEDSSEIITNNLSKSYYVQIGSFSSANQARQKLATVKNFQKGKVIIGYINNKRVFRSVYGPFKNKSLANKSKNRLNNMGIEAILIKK